MYFAAYLTSLLLCFTLTSCEDIFDIRPSESPECSTSCFTLTDVAITRLRMSTHENTTLILQSGNHSLTLPIVVNNTTRFIMYSRTRDVYIFCNQSASTQFVNITTVKIVNITFLGYGNSHKALFEFQNIHHAMIEDCVLQHFKGIIIHSYQSVLKISNTILMNSSSTKTMTLFQRSHVEFENCMIINNGAQK